MYRIPLEAIRDNPWQTRTQYGHIVELAESIYNAKQARPETSGLVQVPPARLWDVDGRQPLDPAKMDDLGDLLALLNGGLVVVQLAAGHRRFRAFQYLAGKIKHDGYEYHTFPVELGVYTDEHMADLVWTENHDRDDLSAIEEAEALQRDMQAFGWSQAEIGFRRGLSRPAVANKLRLLNLPDEAKAAIRRGELTERHGRVLLKAQSLTPDIYKALADELIPIPVADEIAEKARQLASTNWRILGVHNAHEPCALCGTTTGKCLDSVDTRIYLCTACMRLATGWEPFNVAGAENELQSIIDAHARWIDFFPLDAEIGKVKDGKKPLVRQPLCTDCPMLVQSRSGQSCIDGACLKIKTDLWRSHLIHTLESNLKHRWPIDQLKVTFDGYGGHQMDEQNDVDRYLAEHVCSPACPQFSMHHYPYGYCHYVKLTDMPFIAVCGSTAGHKACVKKLGKDKQAQAQLVEHNAALAEQQRIKQQIDELYRRSQAALATSIEHNPVPMLTVIARVIDSDAKNPYTVIAKWLASKNYDIQPDFYSGTEWDHVKLAKYKDRLTNKLGAWGIALPPTADELIERLDKIANFIHGDQPLTAAQIKGNIDNLEKLADEIGQALTLKTLTEADYGRLYTRAVELRGHLVKLLGKITHVVIDKSEPGYISVEISELVSQETTA